MMWLDYVCENTHQAMESSKSIFSLPPNDRDCLSPLLSMYDPSSVLCVYSFPFCFSCLPNTVANSSLPNQIWVVVARDGSSPVPPIVSTSFSHDSFFSHNSAHSSLCPSPAMAMLSVLRALDERDSTPTVVLYCDVMQMASVTDTSTSQEVTLSMASASTSPLESTEDLSPFRLSLSHTRLLLTPLPLLSFSTLNGLFRLLLKFVSSPSVTSRTRLLAEPLNSSHLLSDTQVAETWAATLAVAKDHLLELQPVSFASLAALQGTSVASSVEAFFTAYSDYCDNANMDEEERNPNAFFHVEDSMLSAGVDAMCSLALLHCLKEVSDVETQKREGGVHEAESGINPSEEGHLLSTFRSTYEALLAGLPDVTYKDYEMMDTLFGRITKAV